MEHGASRSLDSSRDGLEQKLCFEKLMQDIAGLHRDLNEKFHWGQVVKETSSVLGDTIENSKGQLPSYAKAQRDLLLKEYADKIKSVTTCASKNCKICQTPCKILQEFATQTGRTDNYALRYRIGKLKKRQSQMDHEVTEDGPVERKRKPLGPNTELRLDTTTFGSCHYDNDFPNDVDLVNVVLMSVAEDITKSGRCPNDMLVVEDLHIVTTQNITSKTEQKRMKKMQTILQSANQKDLKCIHSEIYRASQYCNDPVILEEYATNYLLGQQIVPRCLPQYLNSKKNMQRYSPF